jgi:septal ring-binding cell division protein DamX
VQTGVTLAAPPEDLRMDPLGRYLIARFPKADSAWIIAIGTNTLLGAFQTRWSVDLPAITPSGEVATLGDKDVILLDPEKLTTKSTIAGGAKDFWYFFAWDGFRPRAQGLDQPVTFPGEAAGDSLVASSTPSTVPSTPAIVDTSPAPPPATQPASAGFTVSFAALLAEDKAQQLANTIIVGGTTAHVVSSATAGSPIYRVVLGPYPTRDEAVKIGRASKREYWVYEGSP